MTGLFELFYPMVQRWAWLALLSTAYIMIIPMMFQDDATLAGAWHAMQEGGSASPRVVVFWLSMGLAVAAATGSMVIALLASVRSLGASWLLPGFRERHRRAVAVTSLTVAVLVGALLLRVVDPLTALVAAAMTVLAIALLVWTAAAPRHWAVQAAMVAPLILALFRPQEYAALVLAAPWAFVLVALVAGPWALHHAFSASVARDRLAHAPNRRPAPFPAAARKRGPTADGEWNRSLAGAGLAGWLRAAHYEFAHGTVAGSRGLLGYVVLIALVVHAVGMPQPALAPAIAFGGMLGRLHPALLHPLSRHDRARLVFVLQLIETAGIIAGVAAIAQLLRALHVPSVIGAPETYGTPHGVSYLMLFALAPIAHWGRLRPMKAGAQPLDWMRIALFFVYALGSAVAIRALSTAYSTGLGAYVVAAALAVLMYAVSWAVVSSYHARRDLVPAP